MKTFYFVVETDDPRDEGFAFKDLDYYLEDFNNDMATEYRNVHDFNDGEEYRRIYIIKEINE
tara:strand:+ start:461 stop:646 length:186 start_codon:yes stop_codon:yes gene_type:complete